ncbi:MAG TPA: Crp/Fnr family transcriptional regulator [Pyrinomonadaceae bacterium]|nr:Crp/Fnr family transcriptional regulator [Pyrinomonadaceae bacterium]
MSKLSLVPTKNQILNALPEEDLARLSAHLEPVDLPSGKFLYQSLEPITHVYFPNYSVASIVANTSGGRSTEVGIIGREGAVGLDVLMSVDSSPNECMIQIPGDGLRLPTAVVREEFKLGGAVHVSLLRFIHKLMIQISQTTLCNRLHPIEERLSRWLLMSHDRVSGDEISLTQEFLATMLGVNRPSVSISAGILQAKGFIKYSRGHITVLNRLGIEELTCECYRIVRKEYNRN